MKNVSQVVFVCRRENGMLAGSGALAAINLLVIQRYRILLRKILVLLSTLVDITHYLVDILRRKQKQNQPSFGLSAL